MGNDKDQLYVCVYIYITDTTIAVYSSQGNLFSRLISLEVPRDEISNNPVGAHLVLSILLFYLFETK